MGMISTGISIGQLKQDCEYRKGEYAFVYSSSTLLTFRCIAADRDAESTVTSGPGDIFLAGAIDTDHDTFASQFVDTEQTPAVVFGGGRWMTFEGRYNSGAKSIHAHQSPRELDWISTDGGAT